MTRINTNVSSLVAQNILGRSNADLDQALTRLSTGLRINTGKDDPAGLIASENLRSDITSIRRAIGNTERASQVIATTDSALGQVSSLLNDIRGLVTEAANTGALSQDQIDANQLQIDSSLEALNRIAQTTTFQGRKLLDGSLDFITEAGSNFTNVADLKIDQANLGATGTVSVDINVTAAATKAQVDVTNIPNTQTAATGTVDFDIETTAAVGSTGTVNFSIETTASTQASTTAGAVVTIDTGGTPATIAIDAVDGEEFEGLAGNLTVQLQNGAVGSTPTIAVGGGNLTITAEDGVTTAQNIIDEINAFTNGSGGVDFSASLDSGAGGALYVDATDNGANGSLAGGVDGVDTTETIDITGTLAAGSGGDVDISFAEANLGGAGTNIIGDAGSGYTVQIDNTIGVAIDDIRTAIQSITEVDTAVFNGTPGTSTYNEGPDDPPAQISLIGGVDQVITTETIDITAVAGQSGNVSISFAEADLSGTGTNITGTAGTGYTLQIDSTVGVTIGAIRTAIQSIAEVDTAVFNGGPGTSTYNAAADTEPATVSLSGGADNGLTADLVIELAGTTGAEVLTFENGTSITQLINGINLVRDAIGVEAAANGTTLELTSVEYGSNAFVDLKVITEGTGNPSAGVFTDAVGLGDRQVGADVQASVNGVSATGDGNRLSINTATLDLGATLAADFSGLINFSITGGGALFQLGPNVVSNQQARVGVRSVNTARLGSESGKLFQLGTGGAASLTNDPNSAALIVEEAIDQVTSLRGRLGAFERTTLQTNRNALNDTLVNLTEAESSIRDADFAAETAALTRAQILVQSGTTVLSIANQNPQNVLALLR